MKQETFKSDVVKVNGVRLHYLDWGGERPALIFLAGLGCNAYIFSELAPRFTDRFRVLALTRRGHGDSDHPETGYDVITQTEDILQFMDKMGIEQAVLVGHSLAGVELSHFAVKHPERVLKLIYLDAAYPYGDEEYKAVLAKNPLFEIKFPGEQDIFFNADDYAVFTRRAHPSFNAIWSPAMQENFMHEIKIEADGKVVDRMSDEINQALYEILANYEMEHDLIQAPVLSFFCLQTGQYFVDKDWMTAEQQAKILAWFEKDRLPWKRRWIELYRRMVPQAVVVEIPNGHHYCFLAQEEIVYEEMKNFLEE